MALFLDKSGQRNQSLSKGLLTYSPLLAWLLLIMATSIAPPGNAVALLTGRRTCNLQVAGSSPRWAPLRMDLGNGVISLAGKVTTGLVESNGSLPLGL